MHLHLFCMYLKLTLLAIVLLLSAPTTRAATDVIKANLYVTDSLNTMTGFKAGESFVLNSQIRDQATNATVGAELCACVNLRDGGPSQCEITLQFASGTVQVAGLQYGLPPAQPYSNLTTGLLAVTGGTGLYTGATGYYQEIAPNLQASFGVNTALNGIVVTVNY